MNVEFEKRKQRENGWKLKRVFYVMGMKKLQQDNRKKWDLDEVNTLNRH